MHHSLYYIPYNDLYYFAMDTLYPFILICMVLVSVVGCTGSNLVSSSGNHLGLYLLVKAFIC